MLEKRINLVVAWLDRVERDSAESRIADARMRDAAKNAQREVPQTATQAELARTAIHEAGHAVIAHVAGLLVVTVRIRGDASGSCEYEGEDEIALISTDLAGVFAELAHGASIERQEALSHSSDILQARVRMDELPRTWRRPLAVAAACAVESSWLAILRTASALRALGDLGNAEVAALCGRLQ
jgi:uncharacterized protein (UPF0147 family)